MRYALLALLLVAACKEDKPKLGQPRPLTPKERFLEAHPQLPGGGPVAVAPDEAPASLTEGTTLVYEVQPGDWTIELTAGARAGDELPVVATVHGKGDLPPVLKDGLRFELDDHGKDDFLHPATCRRLLPTDRAPEPEQNRPPQVFESRADALHLGAQTVACVRFRYEVGGDKARGCIAARHPAVQAMANGLVEYAQYWSDAKPLFAAKLTAIEQRDLPKAPLALSGARTANYEVRGDPSNPPGAVRWWSSPHGLHFRGKIGERCEWDGSVLDAVASLLPDDDEREPWGHRESGGDFTLGGHTFSTWKFQRDGRGPADGPEHIVRLFALDPWAMPDVPVWLRVAPVVDTYNGRTYTLKEVQ